MEDSPGPVARFRRGPLLRRVAPTGVQARRRRRHLLGDSPGWLAREWAEKSAESHPRQDESELPGGTRAGRSLIRRLRGGWYTALQGYLSSVSAVNGIELRVPFLDRDLVEFMVPVPVHLLFRYGTPRMLLRDALSDVLPETVRLRGKGTHFSEVVAHHLLARREWTLKAMQRGAAGELGKYIRDKDLTSYLSDAYTSNDSSFRISFLCAAMSWLGEEGQCALHKRG